MILALDIAMTTGYAHPNGSGIFTCKEKGFQSLGYKLVVFKREVTKLIQENDIKLVVYEKPTGAHFTGVRSHANFEGVLIETCLGLGVEYKDENSATIKKFAKDTSKMQGRMGKPEMFESAMDHFKINVIDDNHADALWLYELFKTKLS